MYEAVEVLAPIKKKPGKKLTDAEKASNKAHSRIRVYSGAWQSAKSRRGRIMGDRYRNPLKKYDRINCLSSVGLGKPKAVVDMAEHGSPDGNRPEKLGRAGPCQNNERDQVSLVTRLDLAIAINDMHYMIWAAALNTL